MDFCDRILNNNIDLYVVVFPPQSDGLPVGFISVTSDVDLKQLHDSFDLSELDGLSKLDPIRNAAPPASREDPETPRTDPQVNNRHDTSGDQL